MKQLTVKEWQGIFTQFCHDCFMFWKREGCSIAEAFDKARKETLNLKSVPFIPKGGEPVNMEALQKWEKTYSQNLVKTLYEYEKDGCIQDLRICTHCGFPVFDGYYISADFYCCDKCAIDDAYNGNEEEFKNDLNEANNEDSPLWSEIYYSEWEYPINE